MLTVPFDASIASLFTPGRADDFFALGDYSRDGALAAEMARLAYVKEEDRLARYLQRAGFRQVLALGYSRKGTQAFVAASASAPTTVVAFRGSEPDDPRDVLANTQFILADWHDPAGRPLGRVHGGFARFAHDDDIFRRVKTHLDGLAAGTKVILTGHSLGAALATLMASWMSTAALYSFGAPRVGNRDFAAAIKNEVAVRVANCTDLVTRVPPDIVLDYVHCGAHVYIDRAGKRHDAPSERAVMTDRAMAWLGYWRHFIKPGNVPARELADHAPINYVSAMLGARG